MQAEVQPSAPNRESPNHATRKPFALDLRPHRGHGASVAAKKPTGGELSGKAKIKEVNRLIRLARSQWDAHQNHACRRERDRAMALYESLEPAERDQVPQVLRVWLRYRSEKYFGTDRKGNGASS